jgi:hypothetical protein
MKEKNKTELSQFHSTQLPFSQSSPWIEVKDGNLRALDLFSRHYSRHKYRDGRQSKRFVGPGERIVLLTHCAKALLVWKKFRSMDNQTGISCSIFRNESSVLSSQLIIEAEKLAWRKWPDERLYTYVNPTKIKSSNPGCCFKMAGWKFCGLTKSRRLHILEKHK